MFESNKTFVKISKKADKFFHSYFYIALVTLIGIIGFVFQIEIYSIYAIAIIASTSWVLIRDVTPSFIAMVILAMTPLARYGEVNYFDPLFYLPIILIIAYILHLIIFPIKLKKGRFFLPTLAVAIAITIGGLFSISAKEYFSMPALYYVFSLGIGMLIIYFVLESDTPRNNNNLGIFFAKMMIGVGFMGIAMIISNYIKYGNLIYKSNFNVFISHFQWGNNLSNNLLISMPFAFYLSTKNKFPVFYFCTGLTEYLALVLSLSRGGVLFSTIVLPFVLTAVFLSVKKKEKIKFAIALILVFGIAFSCFRILVTPLWENIFGIVEISSSESRVNLYKLAWENFKKFPIFGTGLAYKNELYYHPQAMCIYWYHSTIFQIIGSLGIVGIIAYGIQFYYRIKTLVEVKCKFNLFLFFAMMGFAGYSMVNVGYFIPFPCMVIVLQMFLIAERLNNLAKNSYNR